jgi:hypothetical protein
LSDSLRQVALPTDLCEAAEQKFGKRFGSVAEFLTFVLQELVRDDVSQMDDVERKMIEQRLKDLGYL